jgi:GntR family transcriptional regulator / MocR family aminotransferase
MREAAPGILPTIPFDRRSKVPFHRQIYEAYRRAILEGRLRPGQRLPSTRGLSAELQISRMPVLNAFDQLLHEGYLEGRVGSGTYVKEGIPDDLGRPAEVRQTRTPPGTRTRHAPRPIRSAGDDVPPDWALLGPFRASQPALDEFPRIIWGRLVSANARNLPVELMAYGDPAGYFPLREAIAQYLRTARAVRCEADDVLIVSGSQMALQLAARSLLSPGDAVCVEEPGYRGARDALRAAGAALVPIALDEEGIDVQAIQSRGRGARLTYVTPSHQYPLGTSMSASRRLDLLEWAERNDAWILEDDYDSEYRYASRPLGALQGMGDHSRVIYLGTFSKVLFPALRVAYVVAPPELRGGLLRLREAMDIFSPTLYQVVLTDFLRDGHFARHIRRMRAIYLARRNALVESLREQVGEALAIRGADGGLHLAAFLPAEVDDRMVVRLAAEHGIAAAPLSECYAGPASRGGLILGFGGTPEHEIPSAVQRLAQAIHAVI